MFFRVKIKVFFAVLFFVLFQYLSHNSLRVVLRGGLLAKKGFIPGLICCEISRAVFREIKSEVRGFPE